MPFQQGSANLIQLRSRNGLGALVFMGLSSSGGLRWNYGELVMRRKRHSAEENVCEHRAADPTAQRRAEKQGDVLPPERCSCSHGERREEAPMLGICIGVRRRLREHLANQDGGAALDGLHGGRHVRRCAEPEFFGQVCKRQWLDAVLRW